MKTTFQTTTFADTTTKVQLTARARIMAVTIKARSGNTGNAYVAESSGVASSAGFELQPGDALELSYEEVSGTVDRSTFWTIGTTSSDQVDWAFTTED